jgi:hypothetical protein
MDIQARHICFLDDSALRDGALKRAVKHQVRVAARPGAAGKPKYAKLPAAFHGLPFSVGNLSTYYNNSGLYQNRRFTSGQDPQWPTKRFW